jgi:hypothetical protein
MHIRFEFLNKDSLGPSDIRIIFTTESSSRIGRGACRYPRETTMQLNMYPRLQSPEDRRLKRQADILHEFGHALGMVHEHTHPDCKANLNYRVLQARNGWDAQKVQVNYCKPDPLRARSTPYDRKSIMHYPIMRGDTQTGTTFVPLNTVLSEGDKKFLMSIYPIESTPKPKLELKQAKKSTKSTKNPTKKSTKNLTKKPEQRGNGEIDKKNF